jgi:REP element-mobilizing transposase RayT
MSGHVRFHEADGIYFLTHRTHQARYLFKPGEETNRILKGALCRAAAICNIDVFAFVYMSNHFHLVVRAPEINLSKFMGEHNGEIALRINFHRGDRSGSVFDGNYSDPQILDEPTFRDKIGYTLCNPVEARAVSHPEKWPGLCSLDAHRNGGTVTGEFLNYTQFGRLRRRGHRAPRRKAMETYEIELAKLPWLEDEPYSETAEEILSITRAKRREVLQKSNKKGFAGRKAIRAIDWKESPDEPKESTEPLCLTSCSETREIYRRKRRLITVAYRQASRRVRQGKPADFPYGTIPLGATKAVTGPRARGSPS